MLPNPPPPPLFPKQSFIYAPLPPPPHLISGDKTRKGTIRQKNQILPKLLSSPRKRLFIFKGHNHPPTPPSPQQRRPPIQGGTPPPGHLVTRVWSPSLRRAGGGLRYPRPANSFSRPTNTEPNLQNPKQTNKTQFQLQFTLVVKR